MSTSKIVVEDIEEAVQDYEFVEEAGNRNRKSKRAISSGIGLVCVTSSFTLIRG